MTPAMCEVAGLLWPFLFFFFGRISSTLLVLFCFFFLYTSVARPGVCSSQWFDFEFFVQISVCPRGELSQMRSGRKTNGVHLYPYKVSYYHNNKINRLPFI